MIKQQVTILLVEDTPVAARLTSLLLKQLGCEVIVANTGQDALNCLLNQQIDLVFLDLGLPDMHGLEVAREIKQKGHKNYNTPIVVLTAHKEDDDLDTANQNILVDHYITKPLTIELAQQVLAKFDLN